MKPPFRRLFALYSQTIGRFFLTVLEAAAGALATPAYEYSPQLLPTTTKVVFQPNCQQYTYVVYSNTRHSGTLTP
jgi:hypothetical protein